MRKFKEITIGKEKIVARELTVSEADTVFTTIEKGYKLSSLDILMHEQDLPTFVIDISIERDLAAFIAENDLAPSEIEDVYGAVKEVNDFLAKSLVMLAKSSQAMTLHQLMTDGSAERQ